MGLKVLSYNLGLMQVRLFNRSVFEPVPNVESRLAKLPSLLKSVDAEILCFQEVYSLRFKKFLIDSLRESHPYSYYEEQKRETLRLSSGLLVLSKIAFEQTDFVRFTSCSIAEKITWKSGFQKMVFNCDENSTVLYNLHLTAGVHLGPEHIETEMQRKKQIDQVHLDLEINNYSHWIIAGDYNCGPQASSDNFEYLKLKWRGCTPSPSKPDLITWDPKNPLNNKGVHKTSPPQKIDHIFVSHPLYRQYQKVREDLVFDKPAIKVGKRAITPSDHYGVILSLS